MSKESGEAFGGSMEEVGELFGREIRKALSSTWPKSTQELLPGYLPNKLNTEYDQRELALYQCAYNILGDMVKEVTVEVVFDEEQLVSDPDLHIEHETRAVPRFKLVTNGGKKSRDEQVAWFGRIAPEGGIN